MVGEWQNPGALLQVVEILHAEEAETDVGASVCLRLS
jgi:hypothetical protein